MIFAYPYLLWLLLLSPAAAFVEYRSADTRRSIRAFLRLALVAALVLAFCRPLVVTHAASFTEVLVVDVGPSMSESAFVEVPKLFNALQGRDARVVAYSNRAERVTDPSLFARPVEIERLRARLARQAAPDDPEAGGAALAAALQLAGTQIVQGGHGRVTVFSNGLVTRGDAGAEAYRLADRGIGVDAHPATVAAERAPQMMVRHVEVTPSAKIGQTVVAEVTLDSQVSADATVMLTTTNGQSENDRSESTAVRVAPGTNRVRLNVPLLTSGLTQIQAKLSVAGDPLAAAENTLRAATYVGGPMRVVVVQNETGPSTAAALARILGIGADVKAVSPAKLDSQSIDAADCLVLGEVPANELSAEAQTHITAAVVNGAGLFVTGVAGSFGPGGYADSGLAPALPVRMPQQAETIDPHTAIVLIIDTSGSMADSGRIDLAKEVARMAMSHLTPHDKVGIVEFFGGRRWAAPIQSAGNVSIIGRALNRLTAGGGTTLYPAVEEAAFALRNVSTQTKHVLILSDGGVENAPFASLLRQMAEDGISVSTVAVAPDGRPNMMPDVARWGGGRFYSVPDRFAMPDITFKRPQSALLSSVVQSPTALMSADDDVLRLAATDAWPTVGGYVRTAAKPTADVLLRTATGDPLLVRWRYGSGFVATLPTQLGSAMTQTLQDTPAFQSLLSGLFRQMGRRQVDGFAVRPFVRPGGVEIDVATVANSAGVPGTLHVKLMNAAGEIERDLRAEPVATGHWNVFLPAVPSGAYKIEARVDGKPDIALAGFAVPAPRAVAGIFSDTGLLDRLGGFKEAAARRAASLPTEIIVYADLAGHLSAAAVMLLVLHVAVRRWPALRKKTA